MLPFIVAGIVTGSLYGLTAVGLVLTYRTSGIFNFAHGAIAAGAAFMFYGLRTQHHIPWPVAAAITLIAFAALVGPGLELITRTLTAAPAALSVVLTVGGFLATEGLLLVISHDAVRSSPPFLPQSGFNLSTVFVPWSDVITAVLALLLSLGLYAYLRSARVGVAMRAVVDNSALVGLAGTRPTRVRRTAWAIGTAFAALSGILLAPILDLDASLLPLIVVEAFGACAVGLFSSLPLTYVGGLGVGIAEALVTKYATKAPFTNVAPAVPFIVLIVLLIAVRSTRLPQTRFAQRTLEARALPIGRTTQWFVAAAGAVLVLVLPSLVGVHLASWTSGLIDFILFASLALLVWTSGQISLCQLSFAALGATSMAHLTGSGVPWPIALVLAGLTTVPIGVLVAIPAIRLSGIYLALVTFGFGILTQDVLYPSFLMFGRGLTISSSRPRLGPIDTVTSDRWLYYVTVVVAVLAAVVLVAVHRSRFGRLLRGLAESPGMLSSLGLDTNATRLIVFCLSAFLAGISGALTVTQFTVSSTTFQPVGSLTLVAVLAVAAALVGTRLILSPILAAGLFAVLPGYVTSFGSDQRILAFGCAAVLGAILLANREAMSARMAGALSRRSSTAARGPIRARWLDQPAPGQVPPYIGELAGRLASRSLESVGDRK